MVKFNLSEIRGLKKDYTRYRGEVPQNEDAPILILDVFENERPCAVKFVRARGCTTWTYDHQPSSADICFYGHVINPESRDLFSGELFMVVRDDGFSGTITIAGRERKFEIADLVSGNFGYVNREPSPEQRKHFFDSLKKAISNSSGGK